MKINICVSKNRNVLGKLQVLDGDKILLECECLARADDPRAIAAGNPHREQLRRNGDTPTGRYLATVGPAPSQPRRSYGTSPVVHLAPVSGNAFLASQPPVARSGLAIHGGDLNPALTFWHGLRPTEGCVRVPPEAHSRLAELLAGREPVDTFVTES